MKVRSGLQTPERSGLPEAVRGAGPLGADAARRSAVSIASPCPKTTGVAIARAMIKALIIVSPADRTSRDGGSRYCDSAQAAGDPARLGNPRRADPHTWRARGEPWVPSVPCGCATALR